ncbi:MAG: radical SAM protein [Victivallaceae bacterium]|nr:radical SAM protein [Victivallaceae bacterium]
MNDKYIFGPVASRRLGISLGVDLVPSKTCPLDCIYCEAGKTTVHTMERSEYIPTDEVIRQLDEVLCDKPELDYITFSGGGEPTLNSGLGRVVDFVKDNYPEYRICLLTNGCLLGDPEVVREIARVDLVIPSLDATTEEEFAIINRQASGLTVDQMLAGLISYAKVRTSKLWLEIFIAPGLNDSDAAIARFVDITEQIHPDKVQLNTLDRPGTVKGLKASDAQNTMRFIHALETVVPVEAVGPFRYRSKKLRKKIKLGEIDNRIIELISRRPATLLDIQLALGIAIEEVKTHLEQMLKSGHISFERLPRGDFYRVVN